MSEVVVPTPADTRAVVSVVVLVADHSVGVAELGALVALLVLGPVLAHGQRALDRHLADEPFPSWGLGACEGYRGVKAFVQFSSIGNHR